MKRANSVDTGNPSIGGGVDFTASLFDNANFMQRAVRVLRCWLAVWALAASACGCSLFSWLAPATAPNDPAAVGDDGRRSPLHRGRTAEDENVVVVRLAFDVTRVIVGTSALKERRDEAWRHVDELRLQPTLHANLARNGFRMGVVRADEGDALRGVLDSAGARYERMALRVQDGVPLSIDLGSIVGSRDVFLTQSDGRLVGTSFSHVAKFIHVDYEVSVTDEPRTTLRVTPELFKESKHPEWSVRDGAPRYQKLYEGMRYHDLAAELDVVEGEMLILGAADADEQPWTLGNTMLVDTVDGSSWETILCIQPKVYRNADTPGQRP